jgi:PAS domain S-box-containing protein
MALAAGAAGLGFWTWDAAQDRIWSNDSLRSMFGFDAAQLPSFSDFFERLHPDDREFVRQGLERSLAGGGDFDRDFRVVLPDGNTRWFASRGRIEPKSGASTPILRGVTFDLTARKQAEERFRIAVEAAPNATLMLDPDGRITLANAKAERMFGYPREELLQLKVEALIPERLGGVHAALRAGYGAAPSARAMGVGRELFGRRKDGSEVPVEIGLSPIRTAEGMLVLASINDITERLRTDQEAARHRAELAHLSRVTMLGELSGSLAHELNQPLAAVLSNAQAALRFLDGGPEQLDEVRDCLVDIVESDKRAGDVIRRLRTLLKKEEVEFHPLDLNEVVVDVLRLTRSDLLNRNVTIATRLATGLESVLGDRVQLQQVLLNLVMNACDAMEALPYGRRLEVRTGGSEAGKVEVVVSDVGKGIPPDQLESIFEPFVTSKAEGMGMGLAVCRTIVKTHGGSLTANNNPAHGASFRFSLPVVAGSPDSS